MASDLAHDHDHGIEPLPRIAWGVIAVAATVVLVAWAVVWRTTDDYGTLIMAQLGGASPTATLAFLGLSAVMMVAMMLPSALPMFVVYRGLATRDAAEGARERTLLFGVGYFLIWMLFTSGSLVALSALGLMGQLTGPIRYLPAVLLVAAGVYQLTGWKQYCLRHCRSPTSFLLTHWRSGRKGALRMGIEHSAYCLGCCWLLMLVLFVSASMSLLWMGVFAGFILAEKAGRRGERIARWLGVAGILVGLYALFFAIGHPTPPGAPMQMGP